MSDSLLYLGKQYDWDDSSAPAVSVNLQADANAIVIKETVGQTVPSFKITDSTGSTVFSIVGGVITAAASPVTTTVSQTMTVNSLTTGTGLLIQSSATAITTTGRMLQVNHTGATGTSATLVEFASAATDETIICQVTASGALALGKAFRVSVAAMTTGFAISVPDLDVLTSGIGLNLVSAATAITGAGRLVFVNHTGATGTSAVLSEFKSAANDETVIFRITATDVLALGIALDVQVGSATTGSGIVVTPTALTTGKAISVTDLAALTTGIGLNITSAATAITGAGRLVFSNHTGTTGTSATLNEFKSAATDETIVVTVNATAALAAGKVLFVSGAAVTTGNLLEISDNTAHTTGTALKVFTNSADTGTRVVVDIKQDHASASGAVALQVVQDSAAIGFQLTTTATGNQQALAITSSATTVTSGVISITGAGVTTGIGIKIVLAALTTGAAIDTTGIAATKQNFNMNSSTGSTAAPQTNAPTGFFKIGIGGTDQWVPYYSAT